ncbi:hypothetical protein DOD47_14555, partial [Shigella flexneri]|nr:hypothetical protein [Shigella flexneri]
YLEALINYEDRWFWKHPGVNPFSVARAAWQDLTSGRVISGGSTLTMQVARLLDPHPKTFGGKILQLWRALQLEWHLSKREILILYLNRAPFGGTLQGIGTASWAYLGKSPANLSYSEAAMLACYRKCSADCARIVGRSVPKPRVIKCSNGWLRKVCGPVSR